MVLALAMLAPASQALAGVRIGAVAMPSLPPAAGPAPAPPSYIDLRFPVPLATVREALERKLPSVLQRPSEVETTVADEIDKAAEAGERSTETGEHPPTDAPVRWRGTVRRGPFRVKASADSLVVSTDLAWSVETLGLAARCGTADAPLTGSLGCASLLGWTDDWSLDARSRPLPIRYSNACRPSPPGLDFTHRVNDRVTRELADRLPARVDSLLRAGTGCARDVRAALALLARPVMIGDSAAWLGWNVRAARVDPPRGADDSVLVHIVFEAQPAITPGPEPGSALSPGPPLVRLSGTGIRVPFDCWVEFEELSRDLASPPGGPEARAADAVRVTAARVSGGGNRIAIAIDLDGAVTGAVWLTGTLDVRVPGYWLEAPDLDWSAESWRALAAAAGPGRWPRLEVSLTGLRDLLRRRLSRPLESCVATWEKNLQDAVQPFGELPMLHGGIHGREVAEVFCTDHAVGVRMLAIGRAEILPARQ